MYRAYAYAYAYANANDRCHYRTCFQQCLNRSYCHQATAQASAPRNGKYSKYRVLNENAN